MFCLHLSDTFVLESCFLYIALSDYQRSQPGPGSHMGLGDGGGLGRDPHPVSVYNYSHLREEQILNCKSTLDLR